MIDGLATDVVDVTIIIIIIENNNNRICIARVCRMTSEALDGRLQSCYAARARPKCPTEEMFLDYA